MSFYHIFIVLLQQQLASVKLLREPVQYDFLLHWTFLQALILRLRFSIHPVSLYLIILTLCIIHSTSLKFFFVNIVTCLQSSPSFCNPLSQQQYYQQHVILIFFGIVSVFKRDTILMNFAVADLTFLHQCILDWIELSLDHIWSFAPLPLTVPFPGHCVFPFLLSSLIFHHLPEWTNVVRFLLLLSLTSLFKQDLSCPSLFRLTLLILFVFSYFLVILPNFHWTIFIFQFLSYFLNFYVCKPLVCSHLPCLICCSVTGKSPISSHIFFIPCLHFLFVDSVLIHHSITILFTALSHFILFFVLLSLLLLLLLLLLVLLLLLLLLLLYITVLLSSLLFF